MSDGNADAVLLRGADVGLIGLGNLGRSLHPLLAPFRPTLRAHDPWPPAAAPARSRGSSRPPSTRP